MKYELINKRNPQLSLLLQTLKNRGVEEVEHYLHVSDEDLFDPELFFGMVEGVDMFLENANQKTSVFLLADSDTDGYTSASIIYNYARRIWPDWVDNHWRYFVHSEKQHGLNDCIDIALKYQFIVIPDASSNDYKEIALLKECGSDVLVLDHHKAEKRAEGAIVINNQFGEYPNPNISGAGVVYKFCKELDKRLGQNIADDFLDLAAVGCIADMVSLLDFETRRIIQKGLSNIKNPLLLALVEKNAYSLKGCVNPHGVSWYIAPTINAISRIGTVEERLMLFEAMLENKAYTQIPSGKRGHKGEMANLVDEAVRIAGNVRSRQNKLRDKKFNELCKIIDEQKLYENKIIVVRQEITDREEKGITGVIANQLVAKYKHPILLLRETLLNDKKCWSGSGRNVANSEIDDLNQFLLSTSLMEMVGGHDNAFGLTISDENLDTFIKTTNEMLKDCTFSSKYKVDDIINANFINKEDIISVYHQKDLWGQEITEPLIAVEKIKLSQDSVFINNKILKINYNGIYYIKFKPIEEEMMFFSSIKNGSELNIVGTCSYSEYDQMPEIIINDYNIVTKKDFFDF